MNVEQLAHIMACPALRAATYLDLILDSMNEFGIHSFQACYFGTIGHESGGLLYTVEQGPKSYFDRYDGRTDLGNTHPGDGFKYRGRGLIQITGFSNYVEISNVLGHNYAIDPDQLSQPMDAARVSAWWYAKHVQPYAHEGFLAVSRAVNLGSAHSTHMPNNWKDRQAYYARALTVYPDFSNVQSGVVTTAGE